MSFVAFPCAAIAQQDTAAARKPEPHHKAIYNKHAVTGTLAVGFIDYYKHNYDMPSGFVKGTPSGFTPLYAKIEYGFSNHWGMSAIFGYDGFVYNFGQLYSGTPAVIRYKQSNARIYHAGLALNYHFDRYLNHRLEPFITAGVALNNIRYSAYPQADSTAIRFDHTASAVLRGGVRYYLTYNMSAFGDVGIDKQSIFSIGMSCIFAPRHHKK